MAAHIALPLSLKLLVLAAIFFWVFLAFFRLFCPPIIRDFRDYTEYTNSGRGVDGLDKALLQVYETRPELRDQISQKVWSRYKSLPSLNRYPKSAEEEFADMIRTAVGSFSGSRDSPSKTASETNDFGSLFCDIREFEDASRPFARCSALALYCLAVGLLAWVSWNNFRCVFRV
jgi:hypothetical protein